MFRPSLLTAAVFTLTALPALSQKDIDLPQLGSPADLTLSPAQEAKLGAEVVAEMYQYDYV
ncbi:MAG: M48 family peptidase, partial [Nevskia sp.]|nr:M48 family peptidase [Nevskia sp.]